jgi:hypothetical protein
MGEYQRRRTDGEENVTKEECALRMEGVIKILKGDGEPGLVADVRKIRETLASMEGREKERESQLNKRDQEIKDALADHNANQSLKLAEVSNQIGRKNLWAAIGGLGLAFAGVAIGVAALVFTVLMAMHHSQLNPFDIFKSDHIGMVYTVRTELPAENSGN